MNVSIPIVRVSVLITQISETISLETEWGFYFHSGEFPAGTAAQFALDNFPNAPISLLDTTKTGAAGQPHWLVPPA